MKYSVILISIIALFFQSCYTYRQNVSTIKIRPNESINGLVLKTATIHDVRKQFGNGQVKQSWYWLYAAGSSKKRTKVKVVDLSYEETGIEFTASYTVWAKSRTYRKLRNIKFKIYNAYKDKNIDHLSIMSKLPIIILLENNDTLKVKLGETTKEQVISKYGLPTAEWDGSKFSYDNRIVFTLEKKIGNQQILLNSKEDMSRKVVKITLQHFN